jgi:hypothetical protein
MGRRPAPTPEREAPAEGGDAQRPPRPPAGRGDARPGMPRPNPAMMPKSPAAFGGGPGARNAGPVAVALVVLGAGRPGAPGRAGAWRRCSRCRPSRRLRPQRRWPSRARVAVVVARPRVPSGARVARPSRSQVEACSSSRVRADGGPDDRRRARPQGQRRDRSPGARCVPDRLRREDRCRRGRPGADAVLARREWSRRPSRSTPRPSS